MVRNARRDGVWFYRPFPARKKRMQTATVQQSPCTAEVTVRHEEGIPLRYF